LLLPFLFPLSPLARFKRMDSFCLLAVLKTVILSETYFWRVTRHIGRLSACHRAFSCWSTLGNLLGVMMTSPLSRIEAMVCWACFEGLTRVVNITTGSFVDSRNGWGMTTCIIETLLADLKFSRRHYHWRIRNHGGITFQHWRPLIMLIYAAHHGFDSIVKRIYLNNLGLNASLGVLQWSCEFHIEHWFQQIKYA